MSRRAHLRVKYKLLCHVRDLDSKTKMSAEIFTEDISEGGLRFRTPDLVPLNHRLSLTIEVPKRKSIEVQAKPVWVSPCQGIDQYMVGVQFIDLPYLERTAIQNFVAAHMPEKISY